MKLLVAAALIGFSMSAAHAACNHMTTAQSTSPELVASQGTAPPSTTIPEGVDDTLTGSTEDDVLKTKLLEEQDTE